MAFQPQTLKSLSLNNDRLKNQPINEKRLLLVFNNRFCVRGVTVRRRKKGGIMSTRKIIGSVGPSRIPHTNKDILRVVLRH